MQIYHQGCLEFTSANQSLYIKTNYLFKVFFANKIKKTCC